jgi:SAM-dependent MidA family methyltransferase
MVLAQVSVTTLCLSKGQPSLYDCLRYCIIEKSTSMQEIEKETLVMKKISW